MERFFIRRPIFAICIAIIMVMLGLISLSRLSIEQYPDITPPVVEVSATYPGADAETVNNTVATPIAENVMGVSDMLYMQSTSANDGTMTLSVTFEIGSDPDLDAIFTQNNVAIANSVLPTAVNQQGVVTRKSQDGFLIIFTLYSDGRYDENFLSNYAYINLVDDLQKINGVGKVQVMGAGEYAMRVWVRPDLMNYYDIGVSDIKSAIEVQAGVYPAGKFGATPSPEGTQYTYTVTLPAQLSTEEEFGDIILKTTSDGQQIHLRDVADVELGSKTYGMTSMFGTYPTAMITVTQSPGSNASDVCDAVKAEMKTLSDRFPDGVQYYPIVDSTQSIKAGINEIINTLIIALVLVMTIIFLFLQDWRASVIPLVAIPVSIIGTFIVFPLLGFSINIISLLGLVLAIGLVVDDAIVVVEAVQVNIAAGMEPHKATADAMRSVASPIVATTIVLLAVFLPVSFMGGITGRLFQQFSVTIAVSVVFSSFNALTLSPALCALLLRKKEPETKGFFGAFNRWFSRNMERYSRATSAFVRHTVRTGIFVAVILVVIAVMWRVVPSGLLPEEDQGYVMISVKTLDNTSLDDTKRQVMRVDSLIRLVPQVQATGVMVGYNVIASITATNYGVIFAQLVDFSKRKLSAMQIAEQLNHSLYADSPAMCMAFVPPSIPGLGVSSGVTFEVQDLEGRGGEYLNHQTMRLIDTLRRSKMLADVSTQYEAGVPQRTIVINRNAAMIKGVSLDMLYSDIAALLGSSFVNNFTRFGRLYGSYIQAAPDFRQDPEALNYYYVDSSSGEQVPLSSFVSVKDTVGVQYVAQFNLYRSIDVTVAPSKQTSSAQAMDLIQKTAAEVLPDDVNIAWSGVSFLENAESKKGFMLYFMALAFVFLVLAALYESWGLPLSILLSVPLAIMGALLFVAAMHIFDKTYINDIFMQISLVMLIGLAAKNSILVVEYADRMFFEKRMSLADATIAAAKLRVRPIIMTAFAFILGVMPLVFANGVYSTARNIMGLALVGGMIFATVIGIFLYPALYYLVAHAARYEKRRTEKEEEQI